ncbi:MAG TPA: hypothetical protein VIK64_14730 [Anaerolineales bacterium]
MTTQTVAAHSTTFKIGWITLLMISALVALNHIFHFLGLGPPDEAPLYIGWAAFNLYSSAVLYIPFRRGERWAWYVTWIQVVGFASVIFFNAEIGPYYLGAAVVMALCLLMTQPAFFSEKG